MMKNGSRHEGFAKALRSVGCVSLVCAAALPAMAGAETMELEAFLGIAQRCGSTVASSTLAAVAKTESGFETLAVSDNTTGQSHIYKTSEEAESAAERFIAKGDSVDIGLMQINSANLKGLGLTVRDALESCKSISAAATILTRNFLAARDAPTEQVALRDAISQYNTGNRADGYRNGYVRKVEQAAKALLPALAPDEDAGDGDDPAPAWDVWRAADRSPAQADPLKNKPANIDVF